MKKFFSLFVLSVCFLLQGQTSNETVPRLAVEAGYLYSSPSGSDAPALSSTDTLEGRNGFFVGLSADNPVNSKFSFRHDLFYRTGGAHFTRQVNTSSAKIKLTTHSLRLHPFSLAYRFGPLQIYGGPYLNMLLAANLSGVDAAGNTYSSPEIFGSEDDDQTEAPYLQKMDYGMVTGAAYRFNFGGKLGVQYSRGFATVFDNSHSHYISPGAARQDLKIYNTDWAVYAGYEF